jgi:hypothetical protein
MHVTSRNAMFLSPSLNKPAQCMNRPVISQFSPVCARFWLMRFSQAMQWRQGRIDAHFGHEQNFLREVTSADDDHRYENARIDVAHE